MKQVFYHGQETDLDAASYEHLQETALLKWPVLTPSASVKGTGRTSKTLFYGSESLAEIADDLRVFAEDSVINAGIVYYENIALD